ncbi:hypothetical protein PFMG_02146 [Plasmodium falciparum IGH-CR14]|uniref:Uncharacterized protein n=1 Tax=Plasmodium falciparum IGH-CR14 TaxID=580059 RepID=A0A0L1I9Y9_PLAFA|nr:hypothetical protein PFMG_02146 [Plasmodium falciparum IGH-CR14]
MFKDFHNVIITFTPIKICSGHTRSHQNSEVKHCKAWLVLRWETAREHQLYKSKLLLLIKKIGSLTHFIRTGHTRSHQNSEVKHCKAWLVLRWETAREHQEILFYFNMEFYVHYTFDSFILQWPHQIPSEL